MDSELLLLALADLYGLPPQAEIAFHANDRLSRVLRSHDVWHWPPYLLLAVLASGIPLHPGCIHGAVHRKSLLSTGLNLFQTGVEDDVRECTEGERVYAQ